MNRAYYADSIEHFLQAEDEAILGKLAFGNPFSLEQSQRDAWLAEIEILKEALAGKNGRLYFEYEIPRMGRRIDALVVIDHVIFVMEFKVGMADFPFHALDQVMDYSLDLKNFHEGSHSENIAPVLIATVAKIDATAIAITPHNDKLFYPIKCNGDMLKEVIDTVLAFSDGRSIDTNRWEGSRYLPTPTIIEAAMALYNGHAVEDISRSDASAINLSTTSNRIAEIITSSKQAIKKSICFVTGVPGAGKTLVGLNIATMNMDHASDMYSVFLSGNGPLVKILREALARDRIQRAAMEGKKLRRGEARSEVKMFIQNVHHFRDECLLDPKPPIEHVAIFDEAQRAWNLDQTSKFMRTKKKKHNFAMSEPEFLISCLDRHLDWAVIICLVGGGQEINTGEAGISEWIATLCRSFPDWQIYISSRLSEGEYGTKDMLARLIDRKGVYFSEDLHLSVSMRSFRAENVSLLVKQLLDMDRRDARQTLSQLISKYPIFITRELPRAKQWLRSQARGSERYGIIVSSKAQRLKPHAIDVKSPMDPVHWFLDGKEDVRSSYFLEDVATEFHVQGLELDWTCVTWDADFRYSENGWGCWSFCGDRWNRINKEIRRIYQKNAYRVLLTRARQGMVIVVPHGDRRDATRDPSFYDPTFNYLKDIGFPVI